MRVIEQNYTDDMADAANVTGHLVNLVNGTGGEWANWSWVQKDLSLEDQGRDSIQYSTIQYNTERGNSRGNATKKARFHALPDSEIYTTEYVQSG